MPPKSKRASLPPQALDLIAARFKVLSEPMRLRLLIALEAGEKNVSDLVAATGATQANVSRHLQTLTDAGILSRRKEGLNVFYTIADPSIFDLCEHVCGSLQKRLAQQAKAFGG
ncbi:MAG: metalloregulator ArsR/SmtB family transcription factor [Verrucomicrobiota bacterium]